MRENKQYKQMLIRSVLTSQGCQSSLKQNDVYDRHIFTA